MDMTKREGGGGSRTSIKFVSSVATLLIRRQLPAKAQQLPPRKVVPMVMMRQKIQADEAISTLAEEFSSASLFDGSSSTTALQLALWLQFNNFCH